MKVCPRCTEVVQEEALVCRTCGRSLSRKRVTIQSELTLGDVPNQVAHAIGPTSTNSSRPEVIAPSAELAMRTCPYCAEEIQGAAIACKHCGREIVPGAVANVRSGMAGRIAGGAEILPVNSPVTQQPPILPEVIKSKPKRSIWKTSLIGGLLFGLMILMSTSAYDDPNLIFQEFTAKLGYVPFVVVGTFVVSAVVMAVWRRINPPHDTVARSQISYRDQGLGIEKHHVGRPANVHSDAKSLLQGAIVGVIIVIVIIALDS